MFLTENICMPNTDTSITLPDVFKVKSLPVCVHRKSFDPD